MNFCDFFDRAGQTGISGLWSFFSDETIADGTPADVASVTVNSDTAIAQYGSAKLTAALSQDRNGVCERDDAIENVSDHAVTVRRVFSRFTLPGGEYEVFTQLNGWENESRGRWVPLVSRAGAENRGLRPDQSAAPMLALWNRQNGHGIVFHLFSSAAWTMTASVQPIMEETKVVVELGVSEKGLALRLAPGEKLALPKIVFYEFTEKRDLECARLHRWFAQKYPVRPLPVMFNTWMMTFDRINLDALKQQAAEAAALGVEYFTVDAGWFGGSGRWYDNIGDYVENPDDAFRGRMLEFADAVRAQGMKFGLWLEIERALKNVPAVKAHPDWFFYNGNEYFVDFGNPEAEAYVTALVTGLIDRYGIDFIKFDFNADISYDPTGAGFLRWHLGHERFLNAVRAARPGIYLENCASGGLRMDLYNATLYDSCWISDHYGIYAETRIMRDTMLRLPPCKIEKWPVFRDADGFIGYDIFGTERKLIACNDAGWGNIAGVNEDWLRTFVCGGPLGMSFDLDTVAPETYEMVKDMVAEYKAMRDDWRGAYSSLLLSGKYATAIQHTAPGGSITIQLFSWNRRQETVDLYPVLEPDAVYEFNGQPFAGGRLRVTLPGTLHASIIRLIRK